MILTRTLRACALELTIYRSLFRSNRSIRASWPILDLADSSNQLDSIDHSRHNSLHQSPYEVTKNRSFLRLRQTLRFALAFKAGGSPAFCRHCSKSASAAAAKSAKNRQALSNEVNFRIFGKACLFRLKTIVKIV